MNPASNAVNLDFLAPALAPDELGRLDRFRILKVLGSGGMGAVLLAEDTTLRRRVALKVMMPWLLNDKLARERFLREARAAAALHHDFIVPIWDVGEDRGVTFLVMPVLNGETLAERLRRIGSFAPGPLLQVALQVSQALVAAHEQGCIHRDVKPSNIWLERAPGETEDALPLNGALRVRLLDFGLARHAPTGDESLTATGAILGTPGYLAPEQLDGARVDGRADLFSLGCVLYLMATGKPAFPGATTSARLAAVATHHPEPVRLSAPALAQPLADLIMQLLAKSPADRPASARDVVRRLEAMVTPNHHPAPPVPSSTAVTDSPTVRMEVPAAPPGRRPLRPWRLVLMALVVIGLFRLALHFTTNQEKPEQGKPDAVLSLAGNPLDRFNRAKISPYELAVAGAGDQANAPAELAAIFGDSRLKFGSTIKQIVFDRTGKRLITRGEFGTTMVWDVTTGQALRSLIGNGGNGLAMSKDEKWLATGHEGDIRIWDLAEGTLIRSLPIPGYQGAECLTASPDGTLLASGHIDGVVRIYKADWAVAAPPVEIKAFDDTVTALAFHPAGSLLATARGDTIRVWDITFGQRKNEWKVEGQNAIDALCYTADGVSLISSAPYAKGVVSNASSGARTRVFDFNLVPYFGSVLAADQKWILGADGEQAHLASLPTGKVERTFNLLNNELCRAALSADGSLLACAGGMGVITLFDTASGRVLCPADPGTRAQASALAFSPDGNWLVLGNRDGWITAHNLASGEQRSVDAKMQNVEALVFAFDGKSLAAGFGYKGTAQVDFPSLTVKQRWPLGLAWKGALSIDPVRGDILFRTLDHVKVIDATTSEERLRVPNEEKGGSVFALGPRGDRLAVAFGKIVRIYEYPSGKELRRLNDNTQEIGCVGYASDGTLITSDGSTTVRVWNADADAPRLTLVDRGGATRIAMHPNARTLASIGYDRTVRFWDLRTGDEGQAITLPAPIYVEQIAFSPDGRYLATANQNGTAYVFRLNQPPATASQKD